VRATRDQVGCRRYTFRDESGYIIAPWVPGVTHRQVTVRHSASMPPWVDRDIHFHSDSEEYYFLFQGELRLMVEESVFTLQPREALMVEPRVPHAVLGGTGPIEHFVLRFPAPDDRQTVGRVSPEPSGASDHAPRELVLDWGCRVPLTAERYQNCWLFGTGQARFLSSHMCLAYLSFPTDESVHADRHPHRLHLHQESWEYYAVLRGRKTLQVEGELVEINAGEILEVPPQVRHTLHDTHTPFEGFTFRVPRLDDKVQF
jgi:mannose-6-phosphate isomerase-like protein (cupin superfamily)